MMKKVLAFMAVAAMALISAYSIPTDAYGFNDFTFSSLYNPSYSDRIEDAMVNPAQLSRLETDDLFYFTFIVSEAWDVDVLGSGEDLSALQNLNTEMHFSFVGNSLSLMATAKTWFANRTLTEEDLSYDIYNRLGIQIDWSDSFDFFSFGLRIRGGGDMRRRNRPVSGVINAVENAYFASFDAVDGSEYFGIGASLALNFDVFSVSYLVDDVISYRNNELFFGWDEILDSSTFAFSLRYPQFTSRGDLTLFRPRIGFSVKGNVFSLSTITFNAALEMQLLPTLSLQFASAYREYEHKAFDFNRYNGILMFSLSAQGENYAIHLMCNVDTGDFKHVYPAIAFTLSR